MLRFRGVLILFLAVLLGLIAAFVTHSVMTRSFVPTASNHQDQKSRTSEKHRINLIVAKRDLDPGEILSLSDVKKEGFLKNEIPADAFRDGRGVLGLTVNCFIPEGQIIRERHLVFSDGEKTDAEFSVKIEPGKRAISIHVSEVSGVSGQLRAGDLVDVIAISNVDIPDFTGERISRIIAEKVKVLRGQGIFQHSESKKDTVTLEVTPEQAVCIASADEGASIRLIARNNNDEKTAEKPVEGIFTRELGTTNNEPSQADLISHYITNVLPSAKVTVHSMPNGLILSGEVPDQDTMDKILKITKSFCAKETDGIKNLMWLTGPQQVQLEVKVAEISTSGLKEIGTEFMSRGSSNFISALFSDAITGTMDSTTAGIVSESLMTPVYGDAFNTSVHVIPTKDGKNDFMAMVSLLKSKGLAKILAEPTLIAISGQEASFQVGGSFPIPVSSYQSTSVQFKEYGTMVTFLPTVITKDTVSLALSTEISEPDKSLGVQTDGVSTPATLSRKVKTAVQLKNGESFAVAGLLKESSSAEVSKVPFLGDIPLIGMAFTKNEWTTKESEIVIFVTVKLVHPVKSASLSFPGENLEMTNPTDVDFFIRGKTGEFKNSPVQDSGS